MASVVYVRTKKHKFPRGAINCYIAHAICDLFKLFADQRKQCIVPLATGWLNTIVYDLHLVHLSNVIRRHRNTAERYRVYYESEL